LASSTKPPAAPPTPIMMSSGECEWEPALLTFHVALNKVVSQHLKAKNNSSTTAYTFKVKTTNPKRYSVRPNVGVMWPGETAQVTVQLPLQKELPPDMAKCKDKFQVLTYPLSKEVADSLLSRPAEERRTALTELWASDAVKDAIVDKIRCAFALDTTRTEPIPEEEVATPTPYSPEPPQTASTPAARFDTPAAPAMVGGTPVDGMPAEEAFLQAGVAMHQLNDAMHRATAEEAEGGRAAEERRALISSMEALKQAMAEQQQLTRTLQARLGAQQTEQRALRQQVEKLPSTAATTAAPPQPASTPLLVYLLLLAVVALGVYVFSLPSGGGTLAVPNPVAAPILSDPAPAQFREEL